MTEFYMSIGLNMALTTLAFGFSFSGLIMLLKELNDENFSFRVVFLQLALFLIGSAILYYMIAVVWPTWF